MARATNEQVQGYSDDRVRRRSQQIRDLLAALADDLALCGDVYEHVSGANGVPATWADTRRDAPPHLLTPGEIGNYIGYVTALIPHIRDAVDYATIQKACVTSPS